MACESLITIANTCGKNTSDMVSENVYLISYNDLKFVTGYTEVYSTSVTGLVNVIALATGSTKFVKYGTVKKSTNIKDTFTAADNGSYSIEQELTFTLGNIASIDSKIAVEKLINNPVVALVKVAKQWVAMGLSGGLLLKGSEGTAGTGSNGRVVTLAGSDSEHIQVVDPTIIASLIAA